MKYLLSKRNYFKESTVQFKRNYILEELHKEEVKTSNEEIDD